jgi:hypothetical protein
MADIGLTPAELVLAVVLSAVDGGAPKIPSEDCSNKVAIWDLDIAAPQRTVARRERHQSLSATGA